MKPAINTNTPKTEVITPKTEVFINKLLLVQLQ